MLAAAKTIHTVTVLSDNCQLPLSVDWYLYPTHPTAHKPGGITAGSDIKKFSDNIRTYSVEGLITMNKSLGRVTMQVVVP
jgi:hypothetical protein